MARRKYNLFLKDGSEFVPDSDKFYKRNRYTGEIEIVSDPFSELHYQHMVFAGSKSDIRKLELAERNLTVLENKIDIANQKSGTISVVGPTVTYEIYPDVGANTINITFDDTSKLEIYRDGARVSTSAYSLGPNSIIFNEPFKAGVIMKVSVISIETTDNILSAIEARTHLEEQDVDNIILITSDDFKTNKEIIINQDDGSLKWTKFQVRAKNLVGSLDWSIPTTQTFTRDVTKYRDVESFSFTEKDINKYSSILNSLEFSRFTFIDGVNDILNRNDQYSVNISGSPIVKVDPVVGNYMSSGYIHIPAVDGNRTVGFKYYNETEVKNSVDLGETLLDFRNMFFNGIDINSNIDWDINGIQGLAAPTSSSLRVRGSYSIPFSEISRTGKEIYYFEVEVGEDSGAVIWLDDRSLNTADQNSYISFTYPYLHDSNISDGYRVSYTVDIEAKTITRAYQGSNFRSNSNDETWSFADIPLENLRIGVCSNDNTKSNYHKFFMKPIEWEMYPGDTGTTKTIGQIGGKSISLGNGSISGNYRNATLIVGGYFWTKEPIPAGWIDILISTCNDEYSLFINGMRQPLIVPSAFYDFMDSIRIYPPATDVRIFNGDNLTVNQAFASIVSSNKIYSNRYVYPAEKKVYYDTFEDDSCVVAIDYDSFSIGCYTYNNPYLKDISDLYGKALANPSSYNVYQRGYRLNSDFPIYNNELTFSTWYKKTSTSSGSGTTYSNAQTLAANGSYTSIGITDDKLCVGYYHNKYFFTSWNPMKDVWYHIVLVKDTAGTNTFKVYIDSVYKGSFSFSSSGDYYIRWIGTQDYTISASDTTVNNNYEMALTKIFDRGLIQEEINFVYREHEASNTILVEKTPVRTTSIEEYTEQETYELEALDSTTSKELVDIVSEEIVGTSISKIVAGRLHSIALTTDGNVFVCGDNSSGQLGLGDKVARNEWTKLNYDANFIDIAVGSDSSYLISDTGILFVAGLNSSGQLGIGSKTSINKFISPNTNDVVKVYASNTHTIIKCRDGKIYATGKNSVGQLGLGDTAERTSFTAVPVYNSTKIAVGEGYTFSLTYDNKLMAVGENSYGQLGIGSSVDQTDWIEVDNITDIKDIQCGTYHTLVLTNDGKVYATGKNSDSQFGLSPSLFTFTDLGVEAKQISSRGTYSMYISKLGEVYASGVNTSGQLGLGDNDAREDFTLLQQESVLEIIAGYNHTFIRKFDKSIKAVGQNTKGQLGTGNFTNSYIWLDTNSDLNEDTYTKYTIETFDQLEQSIVLKLNGEVDELEVSMWH